ncbi:MAG: hypothetical protein JXR56_01135, partial [Candidatus Cloacimonetes bacterium]|nr:hypothetical protein [Candidatus Cloacimonadota bacterium]
MLLTILILPVLFAIIVWIANNPGLNNRLIIIHAFAHLGTSVYFLFKKENYPGYFSTDALGIFFFFIISLLYVAVAIYNASFITVEDKKRHSIYSLSLILFVFAMDGAVLASNLGLTWVFIETTTLASAVLIYHERTRTALEASWKYIFICSIGIALAFVGILLLFIAIPQDSSLDYHNLYHLAGSIDPFWLKVAFVFMLCGFGTKLGLAPLHSWLPDAHSEAPAPVSALLSGALLNTALLPILRMFKLMDLVGLKEMAQ